MNDKIFKAIIGSKVKEARLLKGFSQEDLAKLVGVTSNHISAIEKGKNFPSVPLLMKIASVLGYKPSYFLDLNTNNSDQDIRQIENKIKVLLQYTSKDKLIMVLDFLIETAKKRYGK